MSLKLWKEVVKTSKKVKKVTLEKRRETLKELAEKYRAFVLSLPKEERGYGIIILTDEGYIELKQEEIADLIEKEDPKVMLLIEIWTKG